MPVLQVLSRDFSRLNDSSFEKETMFPRHRGRLDKSLFVKK